MQRALLERVAQKAEQMCSDAIAEEKLAAEPRVEASFRRQIEGAESDLCRQQLEVNQLRLTLQQSERTLASRHKELLQSAAENDAAEVRLHKVCSIHLRCILCAAFSISKVPRRLLYLKNKMLVPFLISCVDHSRNQ